MTSLLIHLQAAGTSLVLDARGPRLRAAGAALPDPVRFAGLDPERHCTVRPLVLGAPPRTMQAAPPAWLRDGSVTLPGRVLGEVGLPPALLTPEQAAVFTVSDEQLSPQVMEQIRR